MSQFAEEQLTIYKYIDDHWQSSWGPLIMENHKNPAAGPGVLHSSVTIVPNPEARVRNSIGQAKLYRNYGFVFFTTYSPQESGALAQKRLVDNIQNLFDDKTLPMSSGRFIVFGPSGPQTLGQRDGTYRIAVSCPFHRDEWQ